MTPLAARLREAIDIPHENWRIRKCALIVNDRRADDMQFGDEVDLVDYETFTRIAKLALLLPECVEQLYEDGHGANAHATCKACQTLARIEREIGGMG